jgi:hypothetical protein
VRDTTFDLFTFGYSSFKTTAMKKRNNTSFTIFKLTLFSMLFLLANSSFGQARWQADVSVVSVTITPALIKKASKPTENINRPTEKVVQNVGDNLKCSITIHNENDDDAQGTMMVVVLPVEVSVVALPSNAALDPAITTTQPFAGHIIFNLGHMAVQQNVTVEFTFTKSKYGNKVGAYAYSDSPDPNPANNYKDATY